MLVYKNKVMKIFSNNNSTSKKPVFLSSGVRTSVIFSTIQLPLVHCGMNVFPFHELPALLA